MQRESELERRASEMRLKTQDWKMDEMRAVEKKHAQQHNTLDKRLFREYGKDREQWEFQAKDIEKRLTRGGFFYRLFKADADREALESLQAKISNYKFQEAQEVEKLKKQQAKEIEIVAEKHKKLDEEVERKIENAYTAEVSRSEKQEYKISYDRGPGFGL